MKSNRLFWKSLPSGLLLAAVLTLPGRAIADWVAFNAHDPGPGTSSNSTTWNVFNQPPGASGPLRDIATGLPLGATVTITTNGVPGLSTGAAPAIGTPAYRTFNGYVGFGSTVSGSAIQLAAATSDMVTYSFAGLDPSKLYSFKGTGIRGLATYTNRWATYEIVGASSFTSAHSAGCLTNGTPGVTFTDSQVCINSGANTRGDIADWEDIAPALDGTFSVTCVQYTDVLPNGFMADGPHSYAISGFRLQEGPPGGSIVIDQPPQNITVGLGDTATFTVLLATGTSPQYQWYRQGAGAIANANFPSFVITNVAPSNAASYYVVISNLAEKVTSTMATLVVTGVPMAIITQPVSQSVQVGDAVSFTVGVTGTRPQYQWYKDNVKITGATTATYTLASAQTTNAGSYFVTASNFLGAAKSSAVNLTVSPHTRAPVLLSAVVAETGQTNVITLIFSETLQTTTSGNPLNYTVTKNGGASVTISNVNASGATVSLKVGGPNWVVGDAYILSASGVAGLYTNYISPDTQIAVSFFEAVFPMDQTWSYFYDVNNATDLGTAWRTNNFDDSSWPSSAAAFVLGTISACADVNTLLDAGPAQTHYFRTHFTASTNTGRADFQLRHVIDDGAVVYLNGQQIFAFNMPTVGTVNYLTVAPLGVIIANCRTNTVKATNLLSGDNVLAVEVHQANPNGGDAAFAAAVRGAITAALPQRPRLQFVFQSNNTIQFSWTGSGLTLEAKSDLSAASWTPVANNVNSFTTTATGPRKFFRLRQ